jgi:hypothetical protein
LKFGSALFSKLKKAYWNLDHVKGKPLVFAIADFHDNASMTWSFSALTEYLYGTRPIIVKDNNGGRKVEHRKVGSYTKETGTKILSGFFNEEEAENVSGVLFSSTGTLSKFTRMGIQAGFREKGQTVFRIGDCYDHKSDRFEPISFSYKVEESGTEKWSEGLNLFHNPNAKYPIDKSLFPRIAHHKLKGEELISWVPDFHPYSSINVNNIISS